MTEILTDDDIKTAVCPLYGDKVAFEMAWPDMVLPEARAVELAVVEKLAEMGGELPEPASTSTMVDSVMRQYWVRTYTADQMHAHYARGVAAGMAQPRRWIPVGERMPTPGDVVQVAGSMGVDFGLYDGEWVAATWAWPITGVTHWQPLSPAPDEKEQTR
jgi:hypothetical protein